MTAFSSSVNPGRTLGSMLRRANSTQVIGDSPRAKLNSARSEEEFRKELQNIKESYARLWDNQARRFETKFGVSYSDPDAISTGRQVIDAKVEELRNQGYGQIQIDQWLWSEDADIGPIRNEGGGAPPGGGTSPADLIQQELLRRQNQNQNQPASLRVGVPPIGGGLV